MKPSTSFLAFLGMSVALIELGYSFRHHIVTLEKSCLPSHVWGNVHYSTKGGKELLVTTCLHKSLCNMSASASDIMRIKFAVSCCAQDRCVPAVPSLPQEDSKLDGLECRTCRSRGYDYCKNSGLVTLSECETVKDKCVRNEYISLDYMGHHFESSCATNTTNSYHSRGRKKSFRHCIQISCNREKSAATPASPTDRSISLQNCFLLTVLCLLLLESWLLNF